MKFFHVVVQSLWVFELIIGTYHVHIAYFDYSVSGLFIEDSDAYKLEISYNYRIIWSIIDCLSKMIEITRFQPGEVRLLKNLLKCQIQTLLSKVPHDTPNFTNDDFMEMVNVVSAVDEEGMSPKSAKLRLLTLALAWINSSLMLSKALLICKYCSVVEKSASKY